MIAIRTFGWSALVLTALVFVGCANEEESTNTSPPSETPTTPATPSPETPPPATPGAATTTGATTPAPAETTTTTEMPKVEGPAIEAPKPTPATKEDEAKPEENKAEDKTADVSLSDEEVASIKELPADEAAIALKQLVCPVSEENLGSMGKPVKVTAEGKTFFLCCKGCNKEVAANPAAVVAKLKK